MGPNVTIRSLETAVPATELRQSEVRDALAVQPDLSRLGKRLVSTSFDVSGIERRFSALTEWHGVTDGEEPVFFEAETGRFLNPPTGARNQVYEREATVLFTQVSAAALEAADGISAEDVTHVITVSCTGFFAPGPDYRIVRDLGLDPAVQRYHLGFMGCYAALPALRQAQTICRAEPDAVVLVATVELCTLHVRTSNDPDTIVGSSLFADGAAAAIITGKDLPASTPLLQLDHFETVLTPVGEEAMAWRIGDHGFEMVLGTMSPTSSTSTSPAPWCRCSPTSPRSRSIPIATSSTGRSTPAAAASSTRSRPSSISPRPSSCPPGRRCATSATCPARP